MLPYARDYKTGEGAYDESTKQARVVRRDSSTLSEGEEIREEDHAGRVCGCDGLPSQICDPDLEAWSSSAQWEEAWAAESLRRRCGGGAGADLGDLWADLLEAAASISAGDGEGAGAVRRVAAVCGDQSALAANEPLDNRSLSGPGAL